MRSLPLSLRKALSIGCPGIALVGRLIVFAGSIVGSLLGGHGMPYLSISITPLNDAGIYLLIVVQHLFLVFSLFYAVTNLSDRLSIQSFVGRFLRAHSMGLYLCELHRKRGVQQPSGLPDRRLRLELSEDQ